MVIIVLQDNLIDKLTKLYRSGVESNSLDKLLNKLKNNEDISIDDLQVAMNVRDNDKHFYESLQQLIQVNMYDPVLASLELPSNCTFKHSVHELIRLIQRKCDSEVCTIYICLNCINKLTCTHFTTNSCIVNS